MTKIDVVVFGATGDAGRCCAHFLFNNARLLNIKSWAPALRNPKKLSTLGSSVSADAPLPADGVRASPHIVADSTDYASCLAMAQQARIIVACAGPFEDYGENIVKACVEAGTDYVDITGETPWVNVMTKKYGEEAKAKGIAMLSQSAYDSVPSDITVALAAQALKAEGERIGSVETHHTVAGGGMPVGTLNTVMKALARARRYVVHSMTAGMVGGPTAEERKASQAKKAEAAALKGKAGLVPKEAQKATSRDLRSNMMMPYSRLSGRVTLPGFMATINTPIVHTTAEALGYGGEGFSYRERMGRNDAGFLSLYGLVPYAFTMATLASVVAAVLPAFLVFPSLVLGALERFNNSDPGGVKAKAFEKLFNGYKNDGLVDVKAIAASQSGKAYAEVTFKSKYDAGLGFTALSAVTVAAAVLEQRDTGVKGKGFETAVVAIGADMLQKFYGRVGVVINSQVHKAKL